MNVYVLNKCKHIIHTPWYRYNRYCHSPVVAVVIGQITIPVCQEHLRFYTDKLDLIKDDR